MNPYEKSTADLLSRMRANAVQIALGETRGTLLDHQVSELQRENQAIEAEIIRRADDIPARLGDLLRDARGYKLADRGLAVSWGRKRKDLLDYLIERGLLR